MSRFLCARFVRSKPGDENAWDFSSDGVSTSTAFPGSDQLSAVVCTGPLFQEVVVNVSASDGVTLRYRLYTGEAHAHVYGNILPCRSCWFTLHFPMSCLKLLSPLPLVAMAITRRPYGLPGDSRPLSSRKGGLLEQVHLDGPIFVA